MDFQSVHLSTSTVTFAAKSALKLSDPRTWHKPAVGARGGDGIMTKALVIVGGGFAGVYAARFLQRRLPRDWEIVLFSQENHFIFTPLLGDVVGSSIN